MTALIRYTVAALAHTQRWVASMLLLIATTTVLWVPPFGVETLGLSLLILFPAAAWLAYATGTVETVSQAAVTITHAKSRTLVWIGKAITAFLIVVILPIASVLIAAAGGGWPPSDVVLAVVAIVTTAITGNSFGMLTAQAAPTAPGWAILMISLMALLDVVVPHVPPVRAYALFFESSTLDTGSFGNITLGALLVAVVCVSMTAIVHRKRGWPGE
ncbi:hypothetical protein [Microbacterium sp.]|uniref:hypothetical protein n=1 Tax=Microbacterium sp. TaxID=51671 RepID=UPI0027323754|nr:hypothetical protein [Microbacterium sp.]MDP3952995.1 hypothetical protein [Microbacterium sp.]